MSQTFVPRSSETAASQVALPLILDLIGPVASVVQVGSGGGEWLDEASRLGVVDVRGIEGSLSFDRSYDLAVCIGVAEHLPHERAASFVADLGRLAPVVAFAAAIPGEGGRDNVNEPGENAPVSVKGATRALVEALGRRARESRPLG
jgi:hypothetical protein